jgi:hypothetical protein
MQTRKGSNLGPRYTVATVVAVVLYFAENGLAIYVILTRRFRVFTAKRFVGRGALVLEGVAV